MHDLSQNHLLSPSHLLHTARGLLLEPYGLDDAHLQRHLANLSTCGINYADLYFQYTRSESWSLEESIVKSGSFSINQGVGVRAVAGERTGFAYSDDISNNAINDAVISARAIANSDSNSKNKAKLNEKIKSKTKIKFNLNSSDLLYQPDDPLNCLSAQEKIKLLENVELLARARDPRIIQVMINLSGEYDVVLVARNDGLIAADIRPLVRLSLTVIAKQNDRREVGSSGGGARVNYSYFTQELINKYVDEAVSNALINLEADPAPAGAMTVVLGPGWPGVLLHEAIGHGLEGDFNRKGSSAFTGKLGQKIAASGVTVVDNGTLAMKRGSLNIDDEGNLTSCTTLIENGILTGYLQDSLNARLMNMPVTGNARRESYAEIPMPRMTNTYMLNGKYDPSEIIASVKYGLYASNFGGGQVDITNGKFVFSASQAYLIENGKITRPVKGASLIGSGPESLKYISFIGNDMSMDPGVGTCGKEGQSVPVGVGQPTLRIDNMTVGGTAF